MCARLRECESVCACVRECARVCCVRECGVLSDDGLMVLRCGESDLSTCSGSR